MSVLGFGYVVNNKARVALERALGNPRKRVMGVEWESKSTFGFMTQGMGVRPVPRRYEHRSYVLVPRGKRILLLVERSPEKAGVGGSIPSLATRF
jgi:hypothetical protein